MSYTDPRVRLQAEEAALADRERWLAAFAGQGFKNLTDRESRQILYAFEGGFVAAMELVRSRLIDLDTRYVLSLVVQGSISAGKARELIAEEIMLGLPLPKYLPPIELPLSNTDTKED